MTDAGKPRAIYLLAHSPFPPLSGVSRRATSIIATLSERFDVTVAAADDFTASDPQWSLSAQRLIERRRSQLALVEDAIRSVVDGQHVLLVRSIRAGVLDAFAALLRGARPALVVLSRPFVGPYLDVANAMVDRVVVDADESLPNVAWGIARSRHARASQRIRAVVEAVAVVGRMERASYPQAGQVWVSSRAERMLMEQFVPAGRVHIIPNVIDVSNGPPAAPEVAAIAFVGSYFYPPNEAAALELISQIMPTVRSRGGPRKLVLIGPDASPTLRRAAATDTDTELTGTVPDIREPIRAAGVLAVPLRAGGGTRVKILEAMAVGVPVVSTALGIEGLNLTPGSNVLLADTPAEFADAFIRLASDAAVRDVLVRSAFEHVRVHNSMDNLRQAIGTALEW